MAITEIQDLVLSLGDPISSQDDNEMLRTTSLTSSESVSMTFTRETAVQKKCYTDEWRRVPGTTRVRPIEHLH